MTFIIYTVLTMALLEYSEIRPRKYIVYNEEPYEVLEYHVARTQQRKPQNQTKLRNLLTGRVIPVSFHAAEKVEEADITKKLAKFMYKDARKGTLWFCDPKNPSDRYEISAEVIGESVKFLKENTEVDVKVFEYDDEETIIGVALPVKMDFKITDAPPAIKGNTASGGNKFVTIETGAQIAAPLFIEAGETIRVNTETGEYVERV
jgi:elongation factor P